MEHIALVIGLVIRLTFKVCCYFVDIVLAKWSKCEWNEDLRYPGSSNYFFAIVILVLIKGKGISKGIFRSILGLGIT